LQGHFANKDDWCTPAAVDAFEKAMKAAGKDFEAFRYEADHAFVNEERAAVHDRQAAELAGPCHRLLQEAFGVNVTISDLRQQPAFFDAVADRIWRAWWKQQGFPADYIAGRLRENMTASPIPFALVAHRNSAFIGTASVIAADLEERPQYSPWVAAVWVDPQYRMREIGSALVARAVEETFALNFRRVYLCAEKERRRFYVRQGWNPIEEDVGERKLTVFVKQAGP
jgi:N-acetylglutamate synthase-like GNAT family acetyltransferase